MSCRSARSSLGRTGTWCRSGWAAIPSAVAGRRIAIASFRPPGTTSFSALGHDPPSHGVVKLQVTGPLTLARALEHGSVQRGADVQALAREISGWQAAAVSDQVRGLGELGLMALVIVDEPGLMAAQQHGATAAAWDALRAAAPAWGLHVCGEVPWRLLDVAEPDVISYDLVRSGCGRLAQA